MSYQEWKERKKRESEEQSAGSASSTQESSGYQKWKQKNGLGTGASTAKKETRLGTSGSSKSGSQDKKSYRTAQMDAVIQKKNERNSTVQRGWEAYQADREAKLKEEQEKPWWQNLAESMQKASYADLPGVNILQMADQYREDTSWQEPSDRWDEAHKRQFGYLYATDPEEARDYAAEFNDYLDRMEKQKKQEALKEQATANVGSGLLGTVEAIGASMGGVGEYIQDVAELAGRGRITERGTYLSPTEYSGAITGGISEHLNEKWGTLDEEVPVIGGKGLGDVYQLGTSVAQSMASAHTLGGLGTLVSYFGQAAASNVDDARNRGASDEQAVAYGALTGLAEGLAEQIDIKQLQALGSAASLKELFGGMLKQGTSEMIEEGVTSLIDTFADNLVLQDKSLMNVRTVEYMANGMTEEEARKRAWLDAAEDTAYDMLGGFVSGGVSGGLETGVKSVGINRNYSSFYGDSAQELVQEGLESPEGSEARALAEAYQLRLDKGENLNGVEIYRMMEANEQQFRAEAELAAENESAIETEENLNPEIVGDSRETEAQEAAVELAEQESGGELGLEEADAVGVIREGIRDLGLAESEEQLLADNFGDGDADQETYIAGIRTAYKYGELGIPERELLRPGNFTDELTENQRRTAYQLGVLYGKEKAAREQAAVKVRNTVPGGTGKVQFDGDWNKLNVQQTAGLKALDTVADALGVEFRIYESYENAQGEQVYRDEKGNEASAPNGFYREGVIHLDLNAGSNAQGTILFTAAHELTHFMKQWSPEGYRRMTDVLMEGYASRGQNVTELVEKQIRLAKSQGIELSYEAAFEEVAADSMESMLADGTIVEDLARLKETDRTVWEEARDWFRSFAEAIRKAYAKLKPDSAEGRMVAEMKETAERLQKLFEEGLVDAGGNFRGAEKNTAGEGGVSENNAETDTKYSFAGRESETANGSALERAMEMQKRGADNERIRQETGWFRGMDGKWRYEIDDSEMRISDQIVNYMRLGDLMKHDKLYAAYPDLADVTVVFQSLGKGVNGAYDPQFDDISLSYELKKDPIGLKYALVHELQHAIQKREGFTKGATVAMWEKRLKQGFDSRRAEDIREAQETERELKRIQEEEPEFYRDMLELESMTPTVPRGEIDWETLEKIQDDPIEWQRYDARREELEGKYGDMKVWDMSDLLYQREKAAKNHGRSSVDLYFDTAGEIEARDVSNRQSKTEEQRKASPPRLGNEDTVFSEGDGVSDEFIPGTVSEQEIDDNISRIAKMDPVVSIKGDEFKMGDGNLLRDVTAFFESVGGSVYNDRIGDVFLRKRGVRHDLGHGMSDEKATSFAAIPAVLQHGKVAGFVVNKGGKGYDSATIVAPITIGNEPYMMGVIVHRSNGENRFYVHDVVAIKEAAPLITGTQNVGETGGATSTISIIRRIMNVKENGSKFSLRDPEYRKAQKAMEQENAKLREDVERLKALVKLQRTVTDGTKFTKTSVETAAGILMEKAGAKGKKAELVPLLNDVYEYIARNQELTWEGVAERADKAVEWLMGHARQSQGVDAYAGEILRELRGTRISLNDAQKAEAANRYGSYNEFRKRTMGSIVLAQDGVPLDVAWQNLAASYPGVFDTDIGDGDMPLKLVEIIDSLRSTDLGKTEYAYNREMMAQDLRREVYDSYWRVSTLKTFADTKQKEIARLKDKHYQQMDKLRTEHREKVQKLTADYREEIRQLRSDHREAMKKQAKEASDRYQASRKNAVESRKRTEMRHKIRRSIKELSNLLNKGTKQRNVKEGMKDFVAQALASAEVLFMDSYTNEDMVRYGVDTHVTAEESHLIDVTRSFLRQRDDLYGLVSVHGEVEDVIAGDTTGFEKRLKEREKLDRKITENMTQLKGVFERERARMNGATVSAVLDDLAKAYRQLGQSDDMYIRGVTDENVYRYLLELSEHMKGAIVKDMNLDQLKELHKAYTMVLTTVRNANKLFAANMKQTRDQLGNQTITEVQKAGGEHGLWLPGEDKLNAFSWNNLKPVYAFERIGSPTLTGLFENVRAGEDRWAQDMTEAREFCLEQKRKHKYDSWDFGEQYQFTSTSGIDFTLNLEQIMSLYAYSKREQAHDHLLKGGFVFDGSTEVQVDHKGIKVNYLNRSAKAHNVSMEILGEIVGKLTAEQKAFVDEMQDYLSTTMGGKGNEVSLQMYGVKLFNEKYYFPLRSASQYMERAKEADLKKEQGQISIVNSGFAKATTPKSSNPVVLSGFMDVWASHVNEMSMYHSFVLPMEDFRRVYNFSSPNTEDGRSISVNSVIYDAYGKEATDYIDQLYRDLNGGAVSDPRETPAKALMSKFKKAAVFTSLSVVVQQPSAIGRAFAIVDPKYFIGGKVDNKRHKALWAELKQYAPVAVIKEMGYFDTGMGKSAQDFINGKEYNTLKEKAVALATDENYRDELLSKGPALADELTWCAMWEAVKRETKAKNPDMKVTSEAFLTAAGKRFTEVITKTQVYDSVLSRSANMRSKSAFMSMWTAFMAEPTTTINMVEDALRKCKQGNKKYAARTLGAVLSSVVLNSLLVSLVYAMRDDDEDETFLEKYVQSFTTEMLDGINVITYYPFLKDIWSALQGFDIERSDMSLITSLTEAMTKLVKIYSKDTDGMDEEELDAYSKSLKEAWWGLADYVTALAGIPVKNVRRDINGAFNVFKTITTDWSGRDTTWGSLLDKVWGDVKNSIPIVGWLPDSTAADKLYKATVSGDTTYQKRLESAYETRAEVDSAIRKGLRANDSRIWEAAIAWNSNDLETYKSIASEIIGEGHFSQDNVVLAIRAEASAMLETESSTESKAKSLFTAEKFAVAISQGNGTMAAYIKADIIKTAQTNGKTAAEAKKSFASSAKSSLKEMFLEGSITESQVVKALTGYCDMIKDDASELVKKWKFEESYGFAYGNREEQFLAGEISAAALKKQIMSVEGKSEEEAEAMIASYCKTGYREDKFSKAKAIDLMTKYGGMTQEEAESRIRYIDFQEQYPDYELSEAKVTRYYEEIAASGISVDEYWTYLQKLPEGAKKEDVLKVIQSMPLTKKQKDALYLSEGYAESKLDEAPWH